MTARRAMVFPSEHRVFTDEHTGATVHQLTNAPHVSHPTYFLRSSFTPGQRSVIFTSYRTGSAQLFEAGFPEGEIRQLTEGGAIHPFSPIIAPQGETVFFVREGSIWETTLDSLEERLVAKFEGQLGECSLSADGRWFVAACRGPSGWGIVTGSVDGSKSRFISFPRIIIHPQFSPLDSDWIEFAADPAPRMHRIRRDGSGLECLYEHDNDEFVVHETFLGTTGDLVFTVWPKALKRINWTTHEISTIADFNAWHITPNRDGTKVLCDTNHPDTGLQLVDVATGARETICLSKATSQGSQWLRSRYALAEDWEAAAASPEKDKALSWMEMQGDTVYGPQWTHPHPSFSPDETMVAFASDQSSHTQVYVAELPEHQRPRKPNARQAATEAQTEVWAKAAET
jgi:oligogalacturonide lyase